MREKQIHIKKIEIENYRAIKTEREKRKRERERQITTERKEKRNIIDGKRNEKIEIKN